MGKIYLNLVIVLNIIFTFLLLGCGADNNEDVVAIDNPAAKDSANKSGKSAEYKIYLITMDLADDFWHSIDAGCREAVAELGGIDYKWIGPDTHEDDSQKVCIEQAINEGANAILLACSSKTGINDVLQKAKDAGIKIVYVDNPADFDHVAFLATDNEAAGVVAGNVMKKALDEAGITSGTIGMAVNKASVTSTALRVKGFSKVFEGTNFKIDDTFFVEDDNQRLKTFIENHPDYVGFFGSNERTTLAAGDQLRASGSKQLIVGFDTSDAVLALVYDGIIHAVIQQNPERMGREGMEIAVKALKGEYTDTNVRIDTGVNIIYRDTLR